MTHHAAVKSTNTARPDANSSCRTTYGERLRPAVESAPNCEHVEESAMADVLPYGINDADNHFNEPLDLYEKFIDPGQRDLAIRYVTDATGNRLQLFAGKPSKFTVTCTVCPMLGL